MKRDTILIFIIAVLFTFSYSLYGLASNLSQTTEADEELRRLEGEEKSILDALFLISQEISELQRQEFKLNEEILSLETSIDNLDENIQEKQKEYDQGLSIMEEVLKNYQQRGPISYLQLILSSDSVGTLIDRINGIRDISRGTGELLERLQEERISLENDKTKLDESLIVLNAKREALLNSINAKEEATLELENRLEALQDERGKYEEWLAQLNSSLAELKPIFSNTIELLSRDIETGNLSENLISISLGLDGVSGIISDVSLNQDLSTKNYPAKVEIFFSRDEMILEMPELHLSMVGSLEQLDEKTLGFALDSGEYMGLTLEKAAMEELFSAGLLELKFDSLLGKNSIRSIRLSDGFLYMNIKTSLF